MTEFAGAITTTPWDREQRPGSVGLPVALAEVAVLAEGVIHRGPSPMGEILARGPQMFGGYLDPRQIGAAFHDGWLRSGDLGRIGEDGEVYVTGRAKDVIIRSGHNIDPTAIEDVALRYPGVGLAAAVGRPDAYAGETPMLFVTPSPGARIDCDALAAFVEEGVIEAPARPRAILVIEDMPTTPVGKIYKPRLREIAAERAARDALEAAFDGAPFEVAARHDKSGLILTARVPDGRRRGRAGRARQVSGAVRGCRSLTRSAVTQGTCHITFPVCCKFAAGRDGIPAAEFEADASAQRICPGGLRPTPDRP
jgi:fatty-acyl-CoA synthase